MAQIQQIHQHIFPNGLALVAQSMPWLQSAAFTLGFPAGCRFDPHDKMGLANLACEMAFRGGAEFTNRELVEALESIGCDYYSSAGIYHAFFGGALPAENLHQALNIYLRVLHDAELPKDQFEDGRNVCLQEIQSIEDDLAGKTMLQLRLSHYGHPFGRNADGDLNAVSGMTLAEVTGFFHRHYQPDGMIIAVAGNLDWEKLKDQIGESTASWQADPIAMPTAFGEAHGYHHLPFDSNQTHIAIAWPGIPYRDPQYYLNRAAIGVLSDGMSSRLFHEVREKRGLCYTVSASCHSLHDRGAILGYSGTTTQSAQETLDVFLQQIQSLYDGITEAELNRLKIQFRSNLIMQQESCRSRVSTLAGDWFHLGRIRTLDEVNERINILTVDAVNEFLQAHPPGPFDIVTLGEQKLEVRDGISTTSVK